MKRLLALLLTLVMSVSVAGTLPARFGHYGFLPTAGAAPPPGGTLPLGINLAGINYYSTELPFLNFFKQAGTSSAASTFTGWYTSTVSGTLDTGEEAYLPLDSNGYATSLTASPTPPGGQKFNEIQTLFGVNMPSVPGVTYPYPSGCYRFKYIGQGTVSITGDGTLTLSNSSSNTYVSNTFTISAPGSSGLYIKVTAINSGTDYPRDMSLVECSETTAYDGGAVFNPTFITALTPFSNVRFMNWTNVNAGHGGNGGDSFIAYTVTATLSSGATSGTLTMTWPQPTGSYPITFIDGETRTASFTLGSASFSWSGGLTNAVSGTNYNGNSYDGTLFVTEQPTFANRPLPTNAFYDLVQGVPLEVEVALCNELAAGCHINIPLTYSDADIESMAQLVMSGTGMQGSYTGLGTTQKASFELSNETWNYTFLQAQMAQMMGQALWPAQSNANQLLLNWVGMRTAQMSSDIHTALSSSLFARAIPVLGGQAASTYVAQLELTTPFWASGPASNYYIKAIAIAPYWGCDTIACGGGGFNAADCTTMTGVTTPLDDFFATLYSQNGTSGNGSKFYASVPVGGWLGQAEGWVTAYQSYMSSNYPGIAVIGYEGGQNFFADSLCAGYGTLVTSAERDSRMGTAYESWLNNWSSTTSQTASNVMNVYQDVYAPISQYGAWGILESIMQTISPLSSAPPKYQGSVEYIQQ